MHALWIASLATRSLLLTRLLWLRSWREWPVLTALIAISVCRSLLLMAFTPQTSPYGVAWAITAPILLIAQIAASREVFRNMCRDFRGIGQFAIRLLDICTLVAVIITGLSLLSDAKVIIGKRSMVALLLSLTVAQRYVATFVVVGLLAGWLYLRKYPAPRTKAVTINFWFLTTWMAIFAATYWVYNLGTRSQQLLAGNILVGADATCALLWAVLAQRHVERPFTQPDMDKIARLEAEHDSLLDKGEEALRRLRGH